MYKLIYSLLQTAIYTSTLRSIVILATPPQQLVIDHVEFCHNHRACMHILPKDLDLKRHFLIITKPEVASFGV